MILLGGLAKREVSYLLEKGGKLATMYQSQTKTCDGQKTGGRPGQHSNLTCPRALKKGSAELCARRLPLK